MTKGKAANAEGKGNCCMSRRLSLMFGSGCLSLLLLALLALPAWSDTKAKAEAKQEGKAAPETQGSQPRYGTQKGDLYKVETPFPGDLFVRAAGLGDMKAVQRYLKEGLDPNVKSRLGSTPLIAAAAGGQLEIVKLLLEKGGDLNIQAQEKHSMRHRKSPRVIQYPGTPLMQAARNGHTKVVLLLLDKGANLETKDEKYRRTALLWAVAANRRATAQALLDKGADPGAKDNQGRNALFTAAILADADTLKLLLARVGRPGPEAPEYPLLRFAAAMGRTENIKVLLAKGENINAQDKTGDTALMWATKAGKFDAVKLLLELGADANIRDREGKKALEYAHLQAEEISSLLFQAEGRKTSPPKEGGSGSKPGTQRQAK